MADLQKISKADLSILYSVIGMYNGLTCCMQQTCPECFEVRGL
ncbi:MAG: hypothetical protein ACRCU3_04145 [Eubacteriaceae bacterium]